jgi:C4-dicarboxylate transporter DctM subunit
LTVKDALRESANTSSMVFLIVIGALYYSRFLAITQIPTKLSMIVTGLDAPRIYILLTIILIWFVLGMLIIPLGIYALSLPIIFPLIVKLGYDPIWFGVVVIKLSEIAQVTPPVGLNVFGLKGVAGADTPISAIYKGIWPFVLCDLIVLMLLIMFPQISLWLPNLLMGP